MKTKIRKPIRRRKAYGGQDSERSPKSEIRLFLQMCDNLNAADSSKMNI
jgi:hypothetical protein